MSIATVSSIILIEIFSSDQCPFIVAILYYWLLQYSMPIHHHTMSRSQVWYNSPWPYLWYFPLCIDLNPIGNLCNVATGTVKYRLNTTASRHLMGNDSCIISLASSINLTKQYYYIISSMSQCISVIPKKERLFIELQADVCHILSTDRLTLKLILICLCRKIEYQCSCILWSSQMESDSVMWIHSHYKMHTTWALCIYQSFIIKDTVALANRSGLWS